MAVRPFVAAVVAASTLVATPAPARSDAARMADKLRDPQMQATLAAAVRALSEAMLDVPVAPFLRAAEAVRDPRAARDVPPDLTVRDLAGPRAERMPEELSHRLPAMMGAMGGMAGAVEAMTPALKGMAREMGRAMGEAVGQARRGTERDDRRDGYDELPSAQEE